MKEMRLKKENEAKEGEGMNVIMKKWCSHTASVLANLRNAQHNTQ